MAGRRQGGSGEPADRIRGVRAGFLGLRIRFGRLRDALRPLTIPDAGRRGLTPLPPSRTPQVAFASSYGFASVQTTRRSLTAHTPAEAFPFVPVECRADIRTEPHNLGRRFRWSLSTPTPPSPPFPTISFTAPPPP